MGVAIIAKESRRSSCSTVDHHKKSISSSLVAEAYSEKVDHSENESIKRFLNQFSNLWWISDVLESATKLDIDFAASFAKIIMNMLCNIRRTKNSVHVRGHVTFCVVALLLLLVSGGLIKVSGETKDPERKRKSNDSKDRSPTRVISLAESINRSQKSLQDPERARLSREQWELALKEIKELALDIPNANKRTKTNGEKLEGIFTEWKLLLDQPSKVELNADTAEVEEPTTKPVEPKSKPSRFEGIPSWERMLQDWADDVQEYLERVEAENADYPMATYTQPKPKKEDEKKKESLLDSKIDKDTAETVEQTSAAENSEAVTPNAATKTKISLPVPVPLKAGEAVLPHTDIADKSKRVWIVTTAALPWMTGTAVNPLLRAAYMTDGRTEEGGSVTIMLPWLERKQDRDSVYGDNRQFDTPEEQEAYIRTWLVEKAKLPQAGDRLNIEWYTAWQNKAENSLYSMGDITALIPAEDVDIMILEEPEHLNW